MLCRVLVCYTVYVLFVVYVVVLVGFVLLLYVLYGMCVYNGALFCVVLFYMLVCFMCGVLLCCDVYLFTWYVLLCVYCVGVFVIVLHGVVC